MTLRLVETIDGSHSLIDENLKESYHHLRGAITESKYVFIEQGLAAMPLDDQPLAILEVGLGTGLNVLLTALTAPKLGHQKVLLTSLEPFPLAKSLAQQLNFPQCLPHEPEAARILSEIHKAKPGQQQQITAGFEFTLVKQRLEDFAPSGQQFDLVYLDAFAPTVHLAPWQPAQLSRLFQWLRPGGVMVTYCAMGQFKRDLRSVGFEVETLPGCLGKREMTRARVPSEVDA